MRWQRRRHPKKFGNRFRARFEPLEGRLCLTVSVSTVMVGNVNELQIVGDSGADTVDIIDQGNGSVMVTDGNGTTFGSGTGVNIIAFNGMNGTDTVNYSLAGQLTNNEAIFLKLGNGGGDTANIDLSAGVNANLFVDVTGGHGNDTISATLGSLTAANVALALNGGAGNDNISVSGPSVETTDRLANGAVATAPVNIDDISSLTLLLNGGVGNDTLTTNLESQILGKLRVVALGGPGSDTLVTNIAVNEGSTGKLYAFSAGGMGTDNVTLNVVDNTASSTGTTLVVFDAAIVDLTQNDILTHTGNVHVITRLL
jgi:hypothetical protein